MNRHEITKLRRDVVRRTLHVASRHQLTPAMLRITFTSDQLDGFDSPSPDDHIKIFLPTAEGEKPIMRDFTPRAWDIAAGTLTLDFALHDHGPATIWARNAQPGDTLEIGGPRGSTLVPDDFDWYMLLGDASALPSIARRLETLRPGVPVHVFALVSAASEQLAFATATDCHLHWLPFVASSEQNAQTLRSSLAEITWPEGDGFIWVAAEAQVARSLYLELTENRQHPAPWIKASAYWTHGEADRA